jgi:membrane protease subunit (stomatin/prohibitin family)
MDIYGKLEQASTTTKVKIEQYFTQRGIELLALKIADLRTTEEDQKKIFEYLQFSSKNGESFKRYEVMDRMADAIGNSEGGAAVGTGMLLFPQMFQQLQGQQGGQQQPQQPQQQQMLCPYCGRPNFYPYMYCSSCGRPAPGMQAQPGYGPAPGPYGPGPGYAQPGYGPAPGAPNAAAPGPQGQPSPQGAPTAAAGTAPSYKTCPYCGQDISGLPKTPKYCPYCSEQLY